MERVLRIMFRMCRLLRSAHFLDHGAAYELQAIQADIEEMMEGEDERVQNV